MYKLSREKAEEPQIKLQHSMDHRKKKRIQEKPTSALLSMLKPLTVWIKKKKKKTGKFLKRWEYQTTLPIS